MAKIDLEIIKQVLERNTALTPESLATVLGEMRSMNDALNQEQDGEKPKKLKKQPALVVIMDDEEVVGTITIKAPVTFDEDIIYKCINKAALDNNAARVSNRGKVNNILEAVSFLKAKALKPYDIKIICKTSDNSFTIDNQLDEENVISDEELRHYLNPDPDQTTTENTENTANTEETNN